MWLFLMMFGLFGVVFSGLTIVVSVVFHQEKRRPVYLLASSAGIFVLGTVIGIFMAGKGDVPDWWSAPAMLSPVVMLVLWIRFTVKAYHNRPMTEEQKRMQIERNQQKTLVVNKKSAETGQGDQQRREKQLAKKIDRQLRLAEAANRKAERKEAKKARAETQAAIRRSEAETQAVQRAEEKKQKREQARLASTIVKVVIVGSDSKSKTGSAIGRAIVGDFVAGGVGSIVGASTAKKDGMTKFLVEYADGHKVMESVKDNSLRFQELIKYVHM